MTHVPIITETRSPLTREERTQYMEGKGLPRGFNHETDISHLGLAWARVEDAPETDTTQKVTRNTVATEVDGEYVLSWTVTPIDPATLKTQKLQEIRSERDRRLGLDFEFNGAMFQRDKESIARISGAGTLALAAMMQGAQPGDLNWHGRDTPFAWITATNGLMTMDAQTCFAFGQKAAAVETEIIFAAKALREMKELPEDVKDDQWWP